MPVAMQGRVETVDAKVGCNVLLIETEADTYEHDGAVYSENRKDQQPYGEAFKHVNTFLS